MSWSEIIPPFNWSDFLGSPWQDGMAGDTTWILFMGLLVCTACGLVGTYVVLRRMALIGDAVSHSLLPGIVLAFLLTASRAPWIMMVGAVLAGLATVVIIELIHKHSRVKPDAAIGIVFTGLFSVGVILVSVYAGQVHMDADCVLYGEIGFTPYADWLMLNGSEVAPLPVVQMGGVLLVAVVLLVFFYKELLVTSFDAGLARSLGIRAERYHYGLMIVLSLVIVSAFEAVGAILVIAMLIFPAATGNLLSNRLPVILGLCPVFALAYSLGGIHLAFWLDSSIAGAMVVVASLIFGLVWLLAPAHGVLWRLRARAAEPVPEGQEGVKLPG